MKSQQKVTTDKIKDLDVVIKSFKRRMKKHPEENHRYSIKQFCDEQLREVKRSIKDMEDFLTSDTDNYGEEER